MIEIVKKILLLLVLLSMESFAQKDTSIFIVLKDIEKGGIVNAKNGSDASSLYTLKEQKPRVKSEFFISSEGKLVKKINVPTSQSIISSITLKYTNKNNLPFIIENNRVKNVLLYPDDFKNVDLSSIYKLLQKFSDIYIIDSRYPDNYYKAQKVELMKISKL